jgi:hypothetical protein
MKDGVRGPRRHARVFSILEGTVIIALAAAAAILILGGMG